MTETSGMDPVFAEVAEVIYDGTMDPRELWDLAKSMPDGADMHVNTAVRQEKNKMQRDHKIARTGLLASGVAFAGGLHAVKASMVENKVRAAKATMEGADAGPIGRALKVRPVTAAKIAGAGYLGLHGVELVGDSLAARAQAKAMRANSPKKQESMVRAAERKQEETETPGKVKKYFKKGGIVRPIIRVMPAEQAEKLAAAKAAMTLSGNKVVIGGGLLGAAAVAHHLGRRGAFKEVRRANARGADPVTKALRPVATAAPVPGGAPPLVSGVRSVNSGGVGRGLGRHGKPLGGQVAPPAKPPQPLVPRPTAPILKWEGEISKLDQDKHLVFGWCSVVEVDGQPVVDRQGDYLPLEEVEKSAYTYVIDSRKGGDMHARVRKGLLSAWDEPRHTADMVESFVVTPEKLAKMGLSSSNGALGWWVGFKVNDEDQWQLVKSGDRTAFSIHGTGARRDTVLA